MPEKFKLISVLLPVYNCQDYIFEAVESILQQTYKNFELIIIDDCSTDNTVNKIKTFSDARIKLILKPKNTGLTNSLNLGLQIAKGQYIARMDGDDISLPMRFEKQVSFLEANKDVVLCGSAFRLIHNDFYVSVPENNDEIKVGMLQECKIGHPTVMMRASFLHENKFSYNSLMEPAEDYDLWVRMIHLAKFHNLQEPLLNYRVHEHQVSNQKNQLQIKTALQIKCNLLYYLDSSIEADKIKAYSKLLDNYRAASFSDFEKFIELKKQLLDHNKKTKYFNHSLFSSFLTNLELNFFNFNFKNREVFNWKLLFNYLKSNRNGNNHFGNVAFFKFFAKCLIFYKVR